jgi:Outer membrane protein beta-barrel domain
LLREFHNVKYTRAAAGSLAGTSVNGGQSNALLNSEVYMRLSRTLGALLVIAACGASGAAFADNPVGFYIGAGVGESQNRSDDSRYGYPGYYNDYQFAWQGVVGIRPIRMIGVEAAYIDFGQPYRHHGLNDFNVSGSDSHPTAPALFAVGYLPIPIPFIDIFAKAGVARLSTNVTDFVQQPCVGGGPCPNFVPTDRRQVIDTRFAYGAGVQSKFPFGMILRGEYTRISSQFGDPDALLVSALWQF